MMGLISFFVCIFITIILYFTNNLSTKPNKNIILQTTLPYSELNNENVIKIEQEYKRANILSSIIFLLLATPLLIIDLIFIDLILIFIWIFATAIIQGLTMKKYTIKLRKLKSDNDWFVSNKHIASMKQEISNNIMYTDDDEYWGAFFYNNPHDKNLIVEKRAGIGTTINMAHPKAKLISIMLCGIILAILIPCMFLLGFSDFSDIDLIQNENTITVQASTYKITFNRDDIEEISFIDSLPKKGSKTNGVATNKYAYGHFRYDGLGNCMVFKKAEASNPLILIKLKDQYVILSGNNQEETNEFYNNLTLENK